MTASDSSSSVTSPAERPRIDLTGADLLPPLPSAFLDGRDLDLLAPLTLVDPAGPQAPPPGVDRRALAEALAVANAGYGHPRAESLAAKLADPATRVVMTGQQPGLFGGPLYGLSKAVAAALWAERLEAAGEPAVAGFWVATEDHDFREVSKAVVLTPSGPRALELGDDPAPLMPVGMRTLGPRVDEVLREMAGSNPGERWAGWVERVGSWYRPEARFGEAFSRLLVHLLGERCPLVIDAMLPALKEAERPWLRRIVEERGAVASAFAERDERIAGRGHPLQVAPQPGASPLYYIHGGERRRVEWRDPDRVGLRGEEGFSESVDWLLAAIDENPGVVSPGVLARAPIQDAALGTSILVLGPGEMSYIAQVAPLYGLLGIRPPALAMRPQVLVVGRHQLDKLAALEVALADLVQQEFDLDRALAAGRERDLVGPARGQIQKLLDSLREEATGIDPGLRGPWERTRGQVDRALDAFTAKVAAAVARQNDTARARLEDLLSTCRPLGELQERVLAVAHFPGKYGDGFVGALLGQLDPGDPRHLQVITP